MLSGFGCCSFSDFVRFGFVVIAWLVGLLQLVVCLLIYC